ncbi:MAG: Fur family transcriptional regulator [Chlorobaculum sp.]
MNRFIERCRKAGLKVTPQRLAIYKLLMDCADHPSADWVYRKITDTWPTISFDTVNRTLLTFSEIGVIDMVESYSLSRRFDSQTNNHHHLHCIRCGQITDFCDATLDDVPLPPPPYRKPLYRNRQAHGYQRNLLKLRGKESGIVSISPPPFRLFVSKTFSSKS